MKVLLTSGFYNLKIIFYFYINILKVIFYIKIKSLKLHNLKIIFLKRIFQIV